MMTSRRTTYVLLAAVIAVWGLVAWKICASAKRSTSVVVSRDPRPDARMTVVETLRLDYPDPFLKQKTSVEQRTIRQQPLPTRKQPLRIHVQIAHTGTVAAAGRQFHILTINGRPYELQQGDTAVGFRLYDFDADSLYFEKEGLVYGVKRCE